MLCQFQLYRKSESVIHIYVSILFQILFPYRLLQNIEYSSLCYTVNPCCLSIFFYKFIYFYLFIFGCVGSLFLCEGFLQLWRAGATLHRSARASQCRGLSCCGAQAPDAQAQQLWLTGSVAPRHVGSSQTRARTCVPCTGRQILNHCATREALLIYFMCSSLYLLLSYS